MTAASPPPCTRLVVGCDFSEGSRAGVRLAAWWAGRGGVELELVHALEREPPDPDALAYLSRELRRIGDAECAGAGDLRLGATVARRAADEVLSRLGALDEGSWIVVGAEGASAGSLPHGGLGARLAVQTTAPLLVAPLAWAPRRSGSALAELARILVAVGGPEDATLGRASALAARLGARLAAAHVVDAVDVAAWPEPLRAAGLLRADEETETLRAALQVAFEELVPVEQGDEVHVVRGGPVARDLAGLADSQHADLLVVGAGTTASRLVPLVRCPLLVLPSGVSPQPAPGS